MEETGFCPSSQFSPFGFSDSDGSSWRGAVQLTCLPLPPLPRSVQTSLYKRPPVCRNQLDSAAVTMATWVEVNLVVVLVTM